MSKVQANNNSIKSEGPETRPMNCPIPEFAEIAANTPENTDRPSIFFRSDVSKYEVAAGAIISATTKIAPTASKAPTTVTDETDMRP